MKKKIFTNMICLGVLGIFLLGFHTIGAAAELYVPTTTEALILEGPTNKMVVKRWINAERETYRVKVTITAPADKQGKGSVNNLQIQDKTATPSKLYDITEAKALEDEFLRTTGSPGCTYYFWYGQYWYVCQ